MCAPWVHQIGLGQDKPSLFPPSNSLTSFFHHSSRCLPLNLNAALDEVGPCGLIHGILLPKVFLSAETAETADGDTLGAGFLRSSEAIECEKDSGTRWRNQLAKIQQDADYIYSREFNNIQPPQSKRRVRSQSSGESGTSFMMLKSPEKSTQSWGYQLVPCIFSLTVQP